MDGKPGLMLTLAPALPPEPHIAPPDVDDGFPVYPASFPIADRQPYAYAVDMGVVRSDFAAGNARQRRAYRVMPHALSLTFHLRFEELFLWQNWVNEFAYSWFHCPVSTMYAGGPLIPTNLAYELLRFTGDLAVQSDGWNLVAVTVPAELSPDAFAEVPPFGSGVWIIAGAPADPATGWIIGGTPGAPSPNWLIGGSPALPAVPLSGD
jgi:hypothetical protein